MTKLEMARTLADDERVQNAMPNMTQRQRENNMVTELKHVEMRELVGLLKNGR